jgi:hypothetical protein
MRLTLRTLLAYLDGILDPDDAQDLGKKVDESEYAVGLVHRLRDVMRRLRLGAPSLTDRGPGLDPNTVAEYLDNTLPSERVTDFEKVCLDSDTHLAEVGSCHQILTLVLGEPAEVDAASRQRMYKLQEVHTGTKPPPTPATSAARTTAEAGPKLSLDLDVGDDLSGRRARPKPTVPEYLREPRRRGAWLRAAAVVLAAACLILVVAKVSGQLEPGTPAGNILVRLGIIAPAEQEQKVARQNEQQENNDGKEANEKGNEPKEGTPPDNTAVNDAHQKASEVRGAQVPGKSPTAPVAPNTEPGLATKKGSNLPTVTKGPTTPEKGTTPEKNTPVTPTGESKSPPKATEDQSVPSTRGPVRPPKAKPADDVPPQPEPLGRLLSDDQVLLCSHPTNGWNRVGANQMLIPQHVLALPTYRAKVVLIGVGVTLEVLGGTRVELLGSTPQEMPGIRVLYGRVVLMPLGKGNTQVRVVFGDHTGTIAFADADSIAALEVHNLFAPGSNPEETPARVTAELFAASGTVVWEEAGKEKEKPAKPVRLTPPRRLGFDAEVTGSPFAAKSVPDWITRPEPIRQLDIWASGLMAKTLPTDKPVRFGLLELINSPRPPKREVTWLVLKCLGYVGQFSDMVKALNNPAHKNEWWDFYVPELRAAVARDAETATAVRLALEKEYPQQAGDLYRMLCGYTDEQLRSGDDGKKPEGEGEDKKLVQGLKNEESMALRVLSYWNLKDVTGKGKIYYPEVSPTRQPQAIRAWVRRLDAKEIRFPANPKPRAARAPLAPPEPAD